MSSLWYQKKIKPLINAMTNDLPIDQYNYPPMIVESFPDEIITEERTGVAFSGEFFTPNMEVTCSTGTITNFKFINTQNITFEITCPNDTNNTITITTYAGTDDVSIVSATPSWIDLRDGSGSQFTEEHRAGTTVSRDANGLYTSGNIWSSWITFPSHQWERSEAKQLSLIMKYTPAAYMIGIMSSEGHATTASSQYYQSEIFAYIPSSYVWGFYGTNIGHGGVSNSQTSITIGSYNYAKFVFENNGKPNSLFKVYGLADLVDMDDNSNLLGTWTIGSGMTANNSPIMPAITMGSSNRLVAFKVEDASNV